MALKDKTQPQRTFGAFCSGDGTTVLSAPTPASGNALCTALRRDPSARYGVDIRVARLHTDAADLEEILSALEGIQGTAAIVDRESKTLLCQGTVEDVKHAIRTILGISE